MCSLWSNRYKDEGGIDGVEVNRRKRTGMTDELLKKREERLYARPRGTEADCNTLVSTHAVFKLKTLTSFWKKIGEH